MIGAAEGVRVAALALAYGVAAMGASVEQQMHLAGVVARDDYRLQADLARDVVAGLRDLALMRDVDPFAMPDFVQFVAKDRRIIVDSAVDAVAENQLIVVRA